MSDQLVGIVGTGLIGTSIGLALTAAGEPAPALVDEHPDRAIAAAAMGAGRAATWADLEACSHVVVAVPPSLTAEVVRRVLSLALTTTVSDVASVKSNVLRDIETWDCDTSRYCPAHPIAGRERNGPGSAQAELFDHAVWALCPHPFTSAEAVAAVERLAQLCGARPVTVSPEAHDAALAVVSHAPQLLASALAASLPAAGELAAALAGTGFRDTTRLADSDPDLWADIAAANAARLEPVLTTLADRLVQVASSLREGSSEAVRDLLSAGRDARLLLPGKANTSRRPDWARVGVVLADRPGELARLLGAAGAAGVNVEDLAIEHAVDHPVGFVDLEVRDDQVEPLIVALSGAGWAAHRTR